MAKPTCDCTINCGDDPWIKDGRAEPCMGFKRARAAVQARADMQADIERRAALYDDEAARLDWVIHHIKGNAWRDAGLEYSQPSDLRALIDEKRKQ